MRDFHHLYRQGQIFELSFSNHYMTNYNTIYVYYLNKLHNSLKKKLTKTMYK